MNAPMIVPIGERRRLRASDFEILHAAGALAEVRRAELIDGDIYAMSPQMARHSRVKTRLAAAVAHAAKAGGSDLLVLTEVSVITADDSVPEPDVVLCSYKGDRFVPAATVALVVEVADSTLATDLGRKAGLYAAAGIPEYWVVDVSAERLVRHVEPRHDRYDSIDEVALRDEIALASDPTLVINTSGLID